MTRKEFSIRQGDSGIKRSKLSLEKREHLAAVADIETQLGKLELSDAIAWAEYDASRND